MTCEQCTSLLGLAADCLPISFLDTSLSSPSNGSHTPAKSCESEPQKDGSPACTCTREMFGCSIHPTTPEAWTASMQASLAKILATLESKPDLEKAHAAGFTEKSCASLAWFDRDTSSWKTYQQSFLTGWEPFSETWPRWGMTLGTVAYEHPMSALRITEIGGGASQFATPTTMDSLPPKSPEALHREMTVARPGRSRPANLRDQVSNSHMWPTPRANDAEKRGVIANDKRNGLPAAAMYYPTPAALDYKGARKPEAMAATGRNADANSLPDATEFRGEAGRLNPAWVAWLMGWPLFWTQAKNFKAGGKRSRTSEESPQDATTERTNSKLLEMDKSPCKPQSLGSCSEVNE